jgi:AcrR family transcriptional regulator
MAIRQRLSSEERRAQLVRLGLERIKSHPFDPVLLDQVIESAGISKGLLFHYFATKRDFLAAITESAAAELLAATEVDPERSPAEQLRQGLEGYIGYIEQQPDSYVAIARGAGSDERLFAIFEQTRSTLADRIVAGLVIEPAPLLRLAARGWIAMVEEATLMWLRDQACARDELIEMLEMAALRVLPEVLARV